MESEAHAEYVRPKLKRPTTTRKTCYEQLLWQQFLHEYLQRKDNLDDVSTEPNTTTYKNEYCQHEPKVDERAMEELLNRHPVYFEPAVTYYNKKGEVAVNFKKRLSITKPVELQDEQFG